MHISKKQNNNHVNLLYISEEKNNHYCLIRDFSRLMGDLTKHKAKHFYCYNCLHRFSSERSLNEHKPICSLHDSQKVILPDPSNKMLYFKNHQKQLKVPFAIYADFETFTEKVARPEQA